MNRKIVHALLLLCPLIFVSTSSFGLTIGLNFKNSDGFVWQPWQKQAIERAKNIALARYSQPNVKACVKNNYKSQWVQGVPRENSEPWNKANWKLWVDWQFDVMVTAPVHVWVDAHLMNSDNPSTWGKARVGDFIKHMKDDKGNKWVQNPHGAPTMWLDIKHIGKSDAGMAGTFWHEYLHLIGHSHPNGYQDENWITVFGDCIQYNGVYVSRNPNNQSVVSRNSQTTFLSGEAKPDFPTCGS